MFAMLLPRTTSMLQYFIVFLYDTACSLPVHAVHPFLRLCVPLCLGNINTNSLSRTDRSGIAATIWRLVPRFIWTSTRPG